MAERDQKDDDALPKLDGTDRKLEPSACKGIVFSPAEEPGSGYSEVFATCDLINKDVGEEAASLKVSRLTLVLWSPPWTQKWTSTQHATKRRRIRARNLEKGLVPCLLPLSMNRQLTLTEIPECNLNEIPLKPGFN